MKNLSRLFLPVVLVCLLSVVAAWANDEAIEPNAAKKWTFLVFLNADNNLDSAGVKDLKEMASAGSTDAVNIVVLMDRWHGPAKRYYVKKGHAEVLEDVGEVNMGDWRQLVTFAKWGIETYPAQKYALVIWNHGSGWSKQRVDQDLRGISYDDTDGGHITTGQLEQAMEQIAAKAGKKIEILGFDACLMNMLEVAYQVRDYCDMVVGSEETEPGDGWPYDDICAHLIRKPGMSTQELSRTIVDDYADSYGMRSTTQSAIRASALDELKSRLDTLIAACREADEGDVKGAVNTALGKVERFYYRSYIDFFHFIDLFKGAVGDSSCKAAARAVLDMQKQAVAANAVSGLPFFKKKARGISIYFPKKSGYYSYYENLAFCGASQWDEFVRWNLGLGEGLVAPGDVRLELFRR